jgi:AcrR family transcriptional regulator
MAAWSVLKITANRLAGRYCEPSDWTVTRMSKKNPTETREKLVQAAAQLVVSKGINRVTLEQVALEAGVSKGGLLHHFPTKQALLSGLMEQVGKVFKARLEKYIALETPDQPGRLARAYIRASFEYEADELQLSNAIAQVVSEFPELLLELQAEFAQLDQEMQKDGLPAVRAIVIRLACDGLWFSELIGVSSLQESLREQMRDELLAMTNLEPDQSWSIKLEQSSLEQSSLEQSSLEPINLEGAR